MRIGVDLDNTIICYDKVFSEIAKFDGDKNALRDYMHSLPEGDLLWQRLQGKVYGEFMNRAELFPGVKSFISACALAGVSLFIVSHKTLYGHFDEKKINLRETSEQWLHQQGIFVPVFFEDTRVDKMKRIELLKCTHFIDDLMDILSAPHFPKDVKKYWFNPSKTNLQHDPPQKINEFSTWAEIQNAIFSC